MAAWGALGLAIIAGVVSLLPFGLGSADLVLVALLGVAGIPGAEAAAIAFGYRIVSTLPLGLLGVASYALLSAGLPDGQAAAAARLAGAAMQDEAAGSPPMTILAAALLVGAFVLAAALAVPAARRTGLHPWHPAVAWLGLEAVFFGIGSTLLALDGRPGPALYVAGCVAAFGIALALSDRIAQRRAGATVPATRPDVPATRPDGPDPAPIRPWVVVALAVLGLLWIAPTIARVGLPFLAGDITGARSELTGLPIQELRVAIPALALAVLLTSASSTRQRVLAWVVVGVLLAFDLALASRYLAAELVAVVVVGVGLAGWRVPLRTVVVIGLASVVAFGGIQVLRAYDQAAGRELAFAFERTVGRVVYIQPRTLEALQAVIPDEQPFFGGLTWLRRLGPAFGRPDIPNLGYWIYPRMFPDQTEPGYAAPGLVGEAWANFGPAGLGLFALLGVGVERLGALVARRRDGTGDVIAAALVIVFVARTHALGVNGLAVLLAFVVGWRVLAAGGIRGPDGLLLELRRTVAWRT